MFCCCCCIGGFPMLPCNCENDGNSNHAKLYEIIYIIAYFILFIFLIATLSIVIWSLLNGINLAFFIFIFLIIVGCLVFSILLYIWSNYNISPISNLKDKIKLITSIGFIVTIICLFLCIIEEIIISVGLSKIDSKCGITTETHVYVAAGGFAFKQKSDDNLKRNLKSSKKDELDEKCDKYFENIFSIKGMIYFSLTLIELVSLFGIYFWYKGKNGYFDDIIEANLSQKKGKDIQTPESDNNNNYNNGVNIHADQVIITNNIFPQQTKSNKVKLPPIQTNINANNNFFYLNRNENPIGISEINNNPSTQENVNNNQIKNNNIINEKEENVYNNQIKNSNIINENQGNVYNKENNDNIITEKQDGLKVNVNEVNNNFISSKDNFN